MESGPLFFKSFKNSGSFHLLMPDGPCVAGKFAIGGKERARDDE